MKFDASTSRRNVIIQGTEFNLPEPFAAGHVLTEGEASAMNQLFAENIGNNFRAKIKAAKDGVEGAVMPTQEDLDTYAADYEFGVRQSAGPRTPVDPIEKEMHKLASEAVKRSMEAKGIKLKAVGQEKFNEKVESVLANEQYAEALRAQATKIVKARQNTALGELDLDFGGEPEQAA